MRTAFLRHWATWAAASQTFMTTRPTGSCGLCRRTRLLCRSHLLPRALYRLLRSEDAPNPNPHLVLDSLVPHVPDQVKDYFLCDDCEQRLRAHGEESAMRLCRRGTANFLLEALLRSAVPFIRAGHLWACKGFDAIGIEVDHLAYFAASVVWRGAARNWHLRRRIFMATSLGKRYSEAFRQYLLGAAPFPRDAYLIVMASQESLPILAVQFPQSRPQDGCHHHWFHIPGIAFHMFIGRSVPIFLRKQCLVHSPLHPLYSSDQLDSKVLQAIASQLPD